MRKRAGLMNKFIIMMILSLIMAIVTGCTDTSNIVKDNDGLVSNTQADRSSQNKAIKAPLSTKAPEPTKTPISSKTDKKADTIEVYEIDGYKVINKEIFDKETKYSLVGFQSTSNVTIDYIVDTQKKPEEGNVFVIFLIDAENLTSEYINCGISPDFYVDDVKLSAGINIGAIDGIQALFGALAPRKKRNGYILAEVPQDWKKIELYFLGDYGATNKAITVYSSDEALDKNKEYVLKPISNEDHESGIAAKTESLTDPGDYEITNSIISDKEAKYSLLSFRTTSDELGTAKKKPAQGMVFAIFIIEAENISSEYINCAMSPDFYADDWKYYSIASVGFIDDMGLLMGALASGKTTQGYIVAEVPEDWGKIELYFLGNYGSTDGSLTVERKK